jgi:hypothetical protein
MAIRTVQFGAGSDGESACPGTDVGEEFVEVGVSGDSGTIQEFDECFGACRGIGECVVRFRVRDAECADEVGEAAALGANIDECR